MCTTKKCINKHDACCVTSPKIKWNHSTMTITTRTIAKGIPPRVHAPKGKAKPLAKKTNTTKTTKSHKRAASDSENDEESTSNDSEPPPKKNTKRRRIEDLESEVEVVEDVEPPEEDVEDVDDGIGEERPNEHEVSTDHTQRWT